MIAYEDFSPKVKKMFPTAASVQVAFDNAIAAANRWIERDSVDVLNVESIFHYSTQMPRLVRVWYRSPMSRP